MSRQGIQGMLCAAIFAGALAFPVESSAQSNEPSSRRRTPAAVPTVPSPFETPSALRLATPETDRAPLDFDRHWESEPSQPSTLQLVSGERQLVPLQRQPADEGVELNGRDGLVTLVTSGAELTTVLRMIADQHRLNLIIGPDVSGKVMVSIRDATLEEVLDAILGVSGFRWNRVKNLLYVTGSSNASMDPRVQGRTIQTYSLNYVAAADVESVANELLSSVGTAFATQADIADMMRTRELLVVNDVEAAQHRIAQYIAQVDVPPRQVLIESHILQVALTDEDRHGINLRNLARLDGNRITLEGSGFAEEQSGPSVALRIEGHDMGAFLELLRSHTNSRTLASPKLSVVNHQEARIQIGQRLPYTVATTTQTTTVQSVEFLEVGIVLSVRPVITEDGNVLMTVMPKVSGGKITESGFPEEETTEVETTVLLPDAGGLVIGGLIREEDVQTRSVVPWVSQMPVLGKLFQKRSDTTRRNELIVAIVTHVMPDVCAVRPHEQRELETILPGYAVEALQSPVGAPLVMGESVLEPNLPKRSLRPSVPHDQERPYYGR